MKRHIKTALAAFGTFALASLVLDRVNAFLDNKS